MRHFEIEEQSLESIETTQTGAVISPVKVTEALAMSAPPSKSVIMGTENIYSRHQDVITIGVAFPFVVQQEIACEECGGSGFDPDGIDPWGPEVCPKCRGAKTQIITRNYLAEAFQIAANPDSVHQIERRHLVAVIQHCREAVSALVSLPEVA